MEVFISLDASEGVHAVTVEADDTFADLKDRACRQIGLCADDVVLLFRGVVTDADREVGASDVVCGDSMALEPTAKAAARRELARIECPVTVTALFDAVASQDCSRFQLLVTAGISVNSRDPEGLSPVQYAVQNGYLGIVEAILRCDGCEPDHTSKTAQTPAIHTATLHGDHDLIRLLVSHGASPNCHASGTLPLRLAASSGAIATMDLLVSLGADPNGRTLKGLTLLHKVPSIEVIDWAIDKHGLDVKAQDASGHTPLHHAAMEPCVEHVRALIARGGDPLHRGRGLSNCLHLVAGAAATNELAALASIEVLLSLGVSLTERDKNGKTPLFRAARTAPPETVARLIEAGSDVNAVDKTSHTVLHMVACNTLATGDLIRLLAANGVHLDAVGGKLKKTALHFVPRGNEDVGIELLKLGADPTIADKNGKTALHSAASVPFVEALLEAGARVTAMDVEGKTPLFASGESHEEEGPVMAALLRAPGVEGIINAQARTSGATALHSALQRGSLQAASLLLANGASPTIPDASGLAPQSHFAFSTL